MDLVGEIIDGFLMYNELELLEIRLYELEPVVDKFVLVEATHTHQGGEKPLYFDDHKSWFNKYNIQHIIVPTLQPNKPTAKEVWENEIWQRNHIADGFTDFRDDIGMVSDVDEIPSREFVKQLPKIRTVWKVKQRMSYYAMNTVANDMEWYGTVIAPTITVKKVTPQVLRDCRNDPRTPTGTGYGGWHFSYLGTPEFISDKLQAFTHSEYNTPEFTDVERIRQRIAAGEDILGRGYKFDKIDSTIYPHLVKEDPERFNKYFV